MAIWLDTNSKILVQGMTGSEGTKHTRRMVASGSCAMRARSASTASGTAVPTAPLGPVGRTSAGSSEAPRRVSRDTVTSTCVRITGVAAGPGGALP